MQNRFSRATAVVCALCATAILCVLPAFGTSPQVPPDQDLKNLSLEQLSEIEVTTPSREPVSIMKTPAAVYVITSDDIQRSGANSIPEALRLAPGVEVARIDSGKWSIGIRGFGSRLTRAVLVLIDGRTVYTTLLAGTYWEVQDTLLEDVERIEVIRGPGGTIWGPNAVDGVINIITKNSRQTHGWLVSAGGGNVEQGFLNARFGGQKGEDFSYRVYGKGFTRGPEYHSDGRNFDDWRSVQGGFRIDWDRSKTDSFTFSGDAYKQQFGESVVATSYTPQFSTVLDANAPLSGGNVLARWSHQLANGGDFQVQAYYDRTNRHEPNFAEVRDTLDFDFIQHQPLPWRQNLTFGFGARGSHGDDEQVVSGLTFDPAERWDRLITGFVQDEIALVPNRLTLTVGTKLLNTNFEAFQPEPSGRLIWTPNSNTSIWTAFTHAVRTPSDAERDFFLSGFQGFAPGGIPFFARFNANRDFASEQMNGYEIGVRRFLSPKVYVDVSSFLNHYHGLFSQDITGSIFLESTPAPTHVLLPAEFGNGLKGQTKGIEIAPEWRPTNYWRLRGSYSYLRMNLRKGPNSLDIGSAPGIMGSSPNHQVSIQSSVDITKRFALDLMFRYVSALPGQTSPTDFIHAYSTGDVNFQWHATKAWTLSLIGNDLFQPSHPEFGSDPGTPDSIAFVGIKRNVYGKLTWTSSAR